MSPFLLPAQPACAEQMVWYLKAGANAYQLAGIQCICKHVRGCVSVYVGTFGLQRSMSIHDNVKSASLDMQAFDIQKLSDDHMHVTTCEIDAFARAYINTKRIVHRCNFHHLC